MISTEIERIQASNERIKNNIASAYTKAEEKGAIMPTISRLPDEYQEVEYIESTGTQYIDTRVYFDNNTNIETKFKGNVRDINIISGSSKLRFYLGSSGGVFLYASRNGVVKKLSKILTINGEDVPEYTDVELLDSYVCKNINNLYYVNDNLVQTFNNDVFEDTETLKILKSTIDGIRNALIYYTKIWQNNELIRDFIPCYRKSDNVIGMYDLVTKEFYVNKGTGEFLKGNDVYIPDDKNSANLASTIESIIEKDIDYYQSHPIEYWEKYRPKEYPVLPYPKDNEIYMTIQLDKSDYNDFGFLVNTTSTDYKVQIGDMVNGEFVIESEQIGKKQQQINLHFDSVEKTTYKVLKITAESNLLAFQILSVDKESGVTIDRAYQKIIEFRIHSSTIQLIQLNSNRFIENMYIVINNNMVLPNTYDYNLKSKYIKYLDWTNCNSLQSFNRYINLKSINLFEFKAKAKDMSFFMNGNSSLRKIDLSNFNVDNCTNFAQCFNGNNNTEQFVGMEKWNTSSAINLSSMFCNCYILKDLTSIENWNTSSVTDMSNMFSGCQSLNKLDLSNWDLSSVTNMSNMFQNCYKLTDFNISKIPCSTSFNNDFNLSHDSLLNILNALVDYSDNSNTYTLTLGATNLAKLTEEEIAIGTNKGWTIS